MEYVSKGANISAWGAHGSHIGQDETALGWIEEYTDLPVLCLGLTKDGKPRHPLYLKSDCKPFRLPTPSLNHGRGV